MPFTTLCRKGCRCVFMCAFCLFIQCTCIPFLFKNKNTKCRCVFSVVLLCQGLSELLVCIHTTETGVNDDFFYLFAFLIEGMLKIHFRGVVSEWLKHHGAVLPVKRKVCHLQSAMKDLWGDPSIMRVWDRSKEGQSVSIIRVCILCQNFCVSHLMRSSHHF